jgi:hypothetical protein
MPIEIGSFSIGAVAGGVVIGLFNHFLSKSRSIEAIRITEFNKGAAAFRAAFVDIIFLLRRHKEGASGLIPKIISDGVIVNHEKAKILFEPFVEKSDIPGFNSAWDAYTKCRVNYGTVNTNPTRAEEGQFCLNHIDTLLSYAKPKT